MNSLLSDELAYPSAILEPGPPFRLDRIETYNRIVGESLLACTTCAAFDECAQLFSHSQDDLRVTPGQVVLLSDIGIQTVKLGDGRLAPRLLKVAGRSS